ncbi:hypothetical protein [Bifidobacterium catulorum]|nr:hypothetical protein [Bifidobacterium catulorum]
MRDQETDDRRTRAQSGVKWSERHDAGKPNDHDGRKPAKNITRA